MRIAGLILPCTVTRPTPVSSLSRCASRVSARSLSTRIAMVSEVMAKVTTGASAGFTLE